MLLLLAEALFLQIEAIPFAPVNFTAIASAIIPAASSTVVQESWQHKSLNHYKSSDHVRIGRAKLWNHSL